MPDIRKACAERDGANRRDARRRHRRQRYHRLLAPLDEAVEQLEQLNLADRGACRLDFATTATIRRALRPLPPDVQRCFGQQRTVQGALDGLFTVQEALQRDRCLELMSERYDRGA